LARANAELGQFEGAWHCIGEAMTAAETTKKKWCEAKIHRTAGETAVMSPEPDAAKAQAHFERAIAITRAEGKVLGAARERRAWPGCCAITKNGSRPATFSPPEGF
jgi:predicted ATPase